jgi:glyoxylase-like metal-dependent hydrolase (beta-lactamase superfamily II)
MKQVLIAAAVAALSFTTAGAQPRTDFSKLQITTTDLGKGVYFLSWQGGDSLVLTGPDGVLLVDASVPQMTDKIRAAIAQVSDRPIRFVVNTHAHADHFGGDEALARAGAVVVAHANVRARMASGQYLAAFNQTIPPSPPAALPAVTYTDRMALELDGETVELIHVEHAHTDSDSLVHFRRANVIHASGTFGNDYGYPFFDSSSGGSLEGMIAAQQVMLSLSDANTRIIADEGQPRDKTYLQAQHDMLVKVLMRVKKLIGEGKTEAQAVAARPTADLDATWVPKGGFLTGDRFTQMAYQSLKGIKPPTSPPR